MVGLSESLLAAIVAAQVVQIGFEAALLRKTTTNATLIAERTSTTANNDES